MADLTPFTILFELAPPILVSVAYLVVFRGRRNRFVEAFVALMYIKSVTFFMFAIIYQTPPSGSSFDPNVDSQTMYWIFVTEFLFQFAYALQEFLTWVMLSFIAVLFGMLVLAIKMALQDPLKMKFSNVIKRIVGREPVSDGYSGFRDRLNHLTFEGVPENPMNPAVQREAWRTSWKDYLIIGLATLLPSIPAYVGSLDNYILGLVGDPHYHPPNAYIMGVLIFLTWIYRFGYPASNRIAKGAGLKLGDRDVGAEMMRGVLGWFFRLNILLTLGLLGLDVMRAIANDTLEYLGAYYFDGITQAFPPILFAIVVLPLVERFSVVLYKKVFESITQARSKVRQLNLRRSLLTFVSSIGTAGLMTAAFVGAILGVTLHTAVSMNLGYYIFPRSIDSAIRSVMINPSNNMVTITPGIWVLLVFSIPMGIMILAGVVGHFVRNRFEGGMESFAFVLGFVTAVATYFILPGLDYIVGPLVTPVQFDGIFFYRSRPFINIPGTTFDEQLYRLAFEFAVNVPIFIAAILFILYYFEYRERWQEESGQTRGPLLNVHATDVADAVLLFAVGIVGSILGVVILSRLMDPGYLAAMIWDLIVEIGMPNGLELVYAENVSLFMVLVEHNLIRTLLMLVVGPVFWTLVLWLVAVHKSTGEKRIGMLGVVSALIGIVAAYLWTWMDLMNGVFVPSILPGDPTWPWTYSAQLGVRAAIILGPLFLGYAMVAFIRGVTRGATGGWWFPPLLMLLVMEYFVYDDQFTLISLIILPMILAAVYRVAKAGSEEVRNEDMLITYIRFSLMSLAIAEVLSTALWLAGIGTISAMEGTLVLFLATTLPHGVVEIPAFLFAAAASLRIARDLAPAVVAEDWPAIPSKTKDLLTDGRLWRTYALILFFLLIAALIEAYLTDAIADMVAMMP